MALIANFQLEVDTSVHAVETTSSSSSSFRSPNATLEIHSLLSLGHQMQANSEVSKNVQNIHWAGAFFAFVGGITW